MKLKKLARRLSKESARNGGDLTTEQALAALRRLTRTPLDSSTTLDPGTPRGDSTSRTQRVAVKSGETVTSAERRLQALRKQASGKPPVLNLADGTTEELERLGEAITRARLRAFSSWLTGGR